MTSRGGVQARNYVLHLPWRDGLTYCKRNIDDVNCVGSESEVPRLMEQQRSATSGRDCPLCKACFKKRRGFENSRVANAKICAFIERRRK